MAMWQLQLVMTMEEEDHPRMVLPSGLGETSNKINFGAQQRIVGMSVAFSCLFFTLC
jgi:hypothetical protein